MERDIFDGDWDRDVFKVHDTGSTGQWGQSFISGRAAALALLAAVVSAGIIARYLATRERPLNERPRSRPVGIGNNYERNKRKRDKRKKKRSITRWQDKAANAFHNERSDEVPTEEPKIYNEAQISEPLHRSPSQASEDSDSEAPSVHTDATPSPPHDTGTHTVDPTPKESHDTSPAESVPQPAVAGDVAGGISPSDIWEMNAALRASEEESRPFQIVKRKQRPRKQGGGERLRGG